METIRATLRTVKLLAIAPAICCGCTAGQGAEDDANNVLVLEAKVPLGDVRGRIDHLAVVLGRKRLFVAQLGNGSVGLVDLAAGKLLRRIGGLKEPQGVGYVPSVDALYAASRGDGSVRRVVERHCAGKKSISRNAMGLRLTA